MARHLTAGFCFLACGLLHGMDGVAQTLSPAEEAARSERALTPDEVQRRGLECSSVAPQVLGPTVELGGVSGGQVVQLPALLLLPLVQMVLADDGTYSIATFDPLPNGGIGGADFCFAAQLAPIPADSSVPAPGAVAAMALLLRPGLDLEADYPSTSAEILRRGQLEQFQPGPYGMFVVTDEDPFSELLSFAAIAAGSEGVDPTRQIVRIGDRVFVPLREGATASRP